MGAGVYWMIKVLKVIEDEVEVHAITETEAMALAAQRPDVIRVLDRRPITDDEWKTHDR